mmetsp:Transcript_5209/g.32707  ORF Transcript_5209/g.32707 Transcript_5209/m.32707 type:complete len:210 (+) Transcript_5209:312-941(+)
MRHSFDDQALPYNKNFPDQGHSIIPNPLMRQKFSNGRPFHDRSRASARTNHHLLFFLTPLPTVLSNFASRSFSAEATSVPMSSFMATPIACGAQGDRSHSSSICTALNPPSFRTTCGASDAAPVMLSTKMSGLPGFNMRRDSFTHPRTSSAMPKAPVLTTASTDAFGSPVSAGPALMTSTGTPAATAVFSSNPFFAVMSTPYTSTVPSG